jgi:hypothetical protein
MKLFNFSHDNCSEKLAHVAVAILSCSDVFSGDNQVSDKPIKSYSDRYTLRIKTFNLELSPRTF